MKQVPGGVTAPKGFTASGVHCGVKKGKDIKCINIFGPPESNGILRSGFVKSLQHEQTFSDYGVAALQAAGYPDSFIKFLGGSDHD